MSTLAARLRKAEAALPRPAGEAAPLVIADGGAGVLAAPVAFDFSTAPADAPFPWAETPEGQRGAAWVADAVASLERTRAKRERERIEAQAQAVEAEKPKPVRETPSERTESPSASGVWRL